jgi:hypothetical protein
MLFTPIAQVASPAFRAVSAVPDMAVLVIVAVRVAGFVLLGDEPAG